MNPRISVIIPVFKTEKYLKQALNSILELSIIRDIEVIVVDDASHGNCQNIINQYTKINIIYIKHEYNRGAFYARYTGIINSSGDYITFLDPDDYIINDIYTKAYFNAIDTNSDIVFFNMQQMNEQSELIKDDFNFLYSFKGKSGKNILNQIFMLNHNKWVLHLYWNKLIKKEVIFESLYLIKKYLKHISLYEDFLFSIIIFTFLYNKNTISCLEEIGYVYIRHSNSITHSLINNNQDKFIKNFEDVKYVFESINDVLMHSNLIEYSTLLLQNKLYRYSKILEGNELSYLCKHPKEYIKIYIDNLFFSKILNIYKKNTFFIIDQLINKINSNCNVGFWIFGTDIIAKQIYIKLKEQGINIKGFMLSSKQDISFLGLPILNIQDITDDFKDNIILSTLANEQKIFNILRNKSPNISIFTLN